MSEHQFSVDSFGWVIAKGRDGGSLKSQSVEALLLYEILMELRRAAEASKSDQQEKPKTGA